MFEDRVAVGIFMRRIGELHPIQMASLAARTLRSFDLIYVFEEGTAHQNINKVLDRTDARWVAICDDDVEFLEDHWLDNLLSVFGDYKNVGMVTPIEIKDQATRDLLVRNGRENAPKKGCVSTSWNPGYVMLVDREKVPHLRSDESIPGKSGMSDLDLSLQVRQAGLKTIMTDRTVVFHPVKPLDFDWRIKYDITLEHELSPLHHSQIMYMRQKWGSAFDNAQHFVYHERLGD